MQLCKFSVFPSKFNIWKTRHFLEFHQLDVTNQNNNNVNLMKIALKHTLFSKAVKMLDPVDQ